MAGPCMNDSDCITSSQAMDGTVSWEIRLGDNSGLKCQNVGSGNQGLVVDRLGNTAVVTNPCNIYEGTIRVSSTNELFSVVPDAVYTNQANADHNGIPHTGAWSSDNLNFSITNPYECDLLCLVTGKFIVNYTVEVDASPKVADTLTANASNKNLGNMYSAQIIANVLVNGVDQIEQQFAISGDLNKAPDSGFINLKEYEHFHTWLTMAGGETKTFRTRAKNEGTGELSDNMNTATGDNGIRSQLQVVTFPFGFRGYS